MRATRPNHIALLSFIVLIYFVKPHIIKILFTQFVKISVTTFLSVSTLLSQYPCLLQSDSLLYSQLRHQVHSNAKHTNIYLFTSFKCKSVPLQARGAQRVSGS